MTLADDTIAAVRQREAERGEACPCVERRAPDGGLRVDKTRGCSVHDPKRCAGKRWFRSVYFEGRWLGEWRACTGQPIAVRDGRVWCWWCWAEVRR